MEKVSQGFCWATRLVVRVGEWVRDPLVRFSPEIDYKGIKIDECSEFEGIWLDAGELDAVAKPEKSGFDKFFSIFEK